MTLTVDEDFRRFVAARWPDLEPAARLVLLDTDRARRVTTDVLAELQSTWDAVRDDGAPAACARRAVLLAALEAADGGARRPGRGGARTGATRLADLPGVGDTPPDASVLALVPVLLGATPLERAALVASTAWDLGDDEIAALLGMPSERVRTARESVRGRLLAAHGAARAAEGHPEAEWALDRDLEAALDLVLRGPDDPPDPAELVAARSRRVHRRSVVLGTVGALAVGTAATWGAREVARGAASGAPPRPPEPGDPVWTTTATWPARGRLAGDPRLAVLATSASTTARLLFADDVLGRRVVVAATAVAGPGGSRLLLWAGPEGVAPALLLQSHLVRDRLQFADDVVPLVLTAPRGGGPAGLLLLGRPTVLVAEHSARVRYTPGGDVERTWDEVALRDGVATVPLGDGVPPALRVRIDGYEGGPLAASVPGLGPIDPAAPLGASLVAALTPFVAACTGLAPAAVRSRVVHDVGTRGDVLAPERTGVGSDDGDPARGGRVVVAETLLPGGAVLRSVRVAGDGRGGLAALDVETARCIPAEQAGDPFAVRLPWFRSNTGRFLVVAPGLGAAHAQLVAVASNVYPTSRVSPLDEGTGVLEVVDARLASVYRLVLWDASGRRLGAWRQVFRRGDPRDLWVRPR
ncbi:hypothetical protein GCM10023168_31500 [Fodinibacter luteus]|uniref:DNA-directed RNA polymerase specialized sigma24 family protein n=1 Tax=Fodinibacter luteus TaxID=552064 RepID=A0ABP8KPH6_9MICO